MLDREEIKKYLPQREPFLFLNRVTILENGKKAEAQYAFPADSFFFKGHFPGKPIVPGVLLVEAMAQAAGVLEYKFAGVTWKEKGALLFRLDKVIFRKTVFPEEDLTLRVECEHRRFPVTRFKGKLFRGEELCAEAVIMAGFTEPYLAEEEG